MKKKILITAGLVMVMASLAGCSSKGDNADNSKDNETTNIVATTDGNNEGQSSDKENTQEENTQEEINKATFSNSPELDQEIRYTITYNSNIVLVDSVFTSESNSSYDCVLKANTEPEENTIYPSIWVTNSAPKESCEVASKNYQRLKNYTVSESGEMKVRDKAGYYMVIEYDLERKTGLVHMKMFIGAAATEKDDRSVYISGDSKYITEECGMTYKEFFEAAYVDVEVKN